MPDQADVISIFVVSGGTGASGKELARTALAQFTNEHAQVVVVSQVRRVEQLDSIVAQASEAGGIIVHTLVDRNLRTRLVGLAQVNGIETVDLMGPLLHLMSQRLEESPLGQPGRYRILHEQDLRRIDAIRFTVEHDDGKRAFELAQADLVLAGVSRVGKTPLSVYLSTMGLKVANVPLARGVEPPDELFKVDHQRVVGLLADSDRLLAYRQHRGHDLGLRAGASYTDPARLIEELEYARRIFRRGHFTAIDTTDRSIEESADEIMTIMNRRFG